MEIIADVESLEKMGRCGGLGPLSELFGNPTWLIAPQAFRESKKSGMNAELFSNYHIHSPKLHYKERELIRRWRRKFPHLSKKEIEAIAIAKCRNITYFAYESHSSRVCKEMAAKYMNLPMALKALWAKQLLTKKEVWEIINKLDKKEKITFDKVELIFSQG
ncbi:MAG: hypothetical protein ABIG96_06270 [Candidatus Micrarchaeota archaeon]